MSQAKIARRYAKALLLASSGGTESPDALMEKLETVAGLWSVPDAARVLVSPIMPNDLKKALVDYALRDGGSRVLDSFFCILMDARRLDLLPEITRCFKSLVDQGAGRVAGEVLSVVDLSAKERSDLESDLTQSLKKKVSLAPRRDPSLLGGILIKLGDLRVDMSLRAKLESIRRSALG